MNPLPYTDKKPQGAADFYFAINATFRFIIDKFGHAGFVRWLRDMGRNYFAPVNAAWQSEGLPAVARYWRAFFAAEPGADVTVEESEEEVTLHIRTCPAITHLKQGKRDIVPCFCQHCHYLNQSRAETAGLSMTVEGGNGTCIHRYAAKDKLVQDMRKIKEVR